MSSIVSKASLISFVAKQVGCYSDLIFENQIFPFFFRQGVCNFGLAAPAAQKVTDPIQALFVEKIRDYANKKQAAGQLNSEIIQYTEHHLLWILQ